MHYKTFHIYRNLHAPCASQAWRARCVRVCRTFAVQEHDLCATTLHCKFYRCETSYSVSLRQLPPRLVRVLLVCIYNFHNVPWFQTTSYVESVIAMYITSLIIEQQTCFPFLEWCIDMVKVQGFTPTQRNQTLKQQVQQTLECNIPIRVAGLCSEKK